MEPFAKLREEANLAAADFVLTELDTGITFLDVADTTAVEESRLRNRENANTAYETVLRYRDRVLFNEVQQSEYDTKFNELQNRLKDAGFVL